MSGTVINSTRIECLSKDNYDTWCMQIEALMIKNELWEYVTGEKPMPMVASGADEAALALHQQRLLAWKQSDRKARADLILSIHPSELTQVKRLETSRQV